MTKLIIFFINICISINAMAKILPAPFVYLDEIDPTIIQEMRYAGNHNFLGRPAKGYLKPRCILTRPAASALHQIQQHLKQFHLSLKVYDCYRPQMAVTDFENWSKQVDDNKMQAEFYPRIPKSEVFKLGYIADFSGHSRGSTIDLTLVDLQHLEQAQYDANTTLVACFAPYHKRFLDNSLDMGTGFDCMDETAHTLTQLVSKKASYNRIFLKKIMERYGFENYPLEWWHYTLREEPYTHHYFNFTVE